MKVSFFFSPILRVLFVICTIPCNPIYTRASLLGYLNKQKFALSYVRKNLEGVSLLKYSLLSRVIERLQKCRAKLKK